MKAIDKKSLAIGILLALTAQGLYDVIFYGLQGKILEEGAAIGALFVAAGLLYVIFSHMGYWKNKPEE